MTRRLRFILPLLALVALAAGCSLLGTQNTPAPQSQSQDQDQTKNAQPQAAAYFPVEPGTKWAYTGTGNEFATFSAEATQRQGNLAQITVHSGADVAHVYEITGDQVTERLVSEVSSAEGGNLLNAPANTNRIILKGPLQVGTEWVATAAQNDGGQPEEKRRIEAVGEAVTTPCGRFDDTVTVRITRGDQPATIETYARGVGLVRREFAAAEPIVSELSGFTRPNQEES